MTFRAVSRWVSRAWTYYPGPVGGGRIAMLTALDGYLIALAAVAAYGAVLYGLYRQGRLGPDRALSLFGPALMMKTQRGNALLERLGRFRRFWTVASDLGLLLAGVAMVLILVVLAIDAILVARVPASSAPQVSEALGIPGINPIIPLGYGIVALVVGIVLHELMHGVIARSQRIGVKSVGVLWFVVPIGAFVEQDDDSMQKANRRARGRVAAAGVLANFALTALFFVLLSAVVSSSVVPNATGVGVGYVVPGFPASNASLSAGDIITSVNGTPVSTSNALFAALANTSANETIPLSFYSHSAGRVLTEAVTLTSARSYTHSPADAKRAFLGVSPSFLTPSQLKGELANPSGSRYGPVVGISYWVVLPLASLEPVQGSTTNFFHLSGPLAGLGTSGFWVLANLLFWLAWMNLLLGLSNALPLVPLDGGLLFRDFTGWVASRVKRGWDAAKIDRFSSRAVAVSSILVIFLIVWQFIAPRL
ncbi:MAG: site-2 protease family protein [Thermoplasmata archaeon]|nr:site-2 protease family protein [Thermoplasmata archaeon]MCI4359925.1 site-2 protease family protein [Thermoplasmata archaeon]